MKLIKVSNKALQEEVFNLEEAVELAKELFNLIDVAETTKQDYIKRIPVFLEYVKSNGLNINSFLEFKRYLRELPYYSISTKNKYLATARIFLKELNRIGKLPQDITQNIKGFKQSQKHKKDGITQEELDKIMLEVSKLEKNKESLRLKAILSLLALQGLRQVEVIRLDVSDIDLVSKTAQILGKGRDDKELINLHPETVKALREYMRYCKVKDGALFTSFSNNSKDTRITTRAIRGIVKELLDSLGIEKSTHGFRHYFTTTLIKTYKGDLTQVSRYTRHKSLEMLQVYNDRIITQEDLPRYYRAFKGVSFNFS
jgi:integrase/recombinase XerC